MAAAADPRRRRGDTWALVLLVGLPAVVFVLPALAGYPAVSGDNLIQNFPLRVLVGDLLGQGHLPLWDPYIWSGSPLLGGLNAGAFFPGTLLFVVLPATAAWVGNLLLVYWAAGIGTYVLARQYRLGPLPSLLGAATYAYAGAMAGQIVHLGVVQGMALLPWLALGLLRLSWAVLATGPQAGPAPAPAPGRPWPWVVLLAVVGGLVLLTGEPRAMADAEVLALVLVAWLACRPYRPVRGRGPRLRFLGLSALAGLWAAALGAVQLLPGLHFISASQRSHLGYAFFASGSLHPQWSVLLLVPDLFGGDGLWHQPTYFNSYNLPEVVGYVGLVPLVALCALATVSVGRRRDPRSSDWGPWMVLAGVGLVLAWGQYTFLGPVFGHLPLFDRVRLQSRNLGLCDLGLALLGAFWVARLLERRPAPGTAGWRRAVAVAPAATTAVLCVVALAVPDRLEEAFGATVAGAAEGVALRPWLAAQLAVALAVGALVLWWRRLPPAARRRALGAVVALDLALFTASTSTGLVPGEATVSPSPATAAAVLGTSGRFALYDTTAQNVDLLSEVGQPDLNLLTGRPSVQGYGSIVDDRYGAATGTHDFDTIDACAVRRGTFVPLRLSTMVTLGAFLAPPVGDTLVPTAPSCPGAPPPGTAGRRTFYFGQRLAVSAADLQRQGPPTAAALRVGLVGPGGGVTWSRAVVRTAPSGWRVTLPGAPAGYGLVVAGPARSVADTSTVTAGGVAYRLDGYLQDAMGTAGWGFRREWHQYSVFSHPVRRATAWLLGPGTVRQVSAGDDGTEVDRVRAPGPVELVRSEADQPGWVATGAAGGRTWSLPVRSWKLLQSVRVPAGTTTVTFVYRPAGLTAGMAATGAGLVALGASAGLWWRRRRSPGRAPAAVPGPPAANPPPPGAALPPPGAAAPVRAVPDPAPGAR